MSIRGSISAQDRFVHLVNGILFGEIPGPSKQRLEHSFLNPCIADVGAMNSSGSKNNRRGVLPKLLMCMGAEGSLRLLFMPTPRLVLLLALFD